jgi:hypothetical protein
LTSPDGGFRYHRGGSFHENERGNPDMKIFAAVCTALMVCPMALAENPDPLAPAGRWSAYAAGHAPTPPMGWNSWNAFASAVDEE